LNCAAWTAVDAAEKDPSGCHAANEHAVAALAEACNGMHAVLVHVSTDYVFGADAARSEPYTEEDVPGPLSVYGRSKLAGEAAARTAHEHIIVRTCGLYAVGDRGPTRGRNFADTMLALSQERSEVRVVSDQTCTPSYVPHVAMGMLALVRAKAQGTFHVTNSGSTSWHGFAEELFRAAGIPMTAVPISWRDYPSPVMRPSFSVLATKKLRDTAGIELPDWRTAVAEYAATARIAYGLTENRRCAQCS
jgi:dTDP-4-dehydrorhamnose reductase